MAYYLIYVSAALADFSDQELKALLESSRIRNSSKGITGMLLYYDGNFIQVLEGEQTSVLELFDAIKEDPRHHHVMKILDGFRDEKKFPDWSMGFYTMNEGDFSAILGYKSFKSKSLFEELNENTGKHPAITVLRSFYKSQPMYRRSLGDNTP